MTWLQDDRVFEPDASSTRSSTRSASSRREPDGRSGDLPSVERAADELRRAGFRDVAADGSWLEHRFTVEGYVAFLAEFDEESLFEELEPAFRERLLGASPRAARATARPTS